MRNRISLFTYVTILFSLETILQITYYSIRIKFFDNYTIYTKFDKLLLDAFYVIGTIKIVFFLPVYLIFYYLVSVERKNITGLRKTIYHSLLFLSIYLLLSFLLPGNIANRVTDTVGLALIAFMTSLSFGEVHRKLLG